jgi:hypothetical protein
VKLLLDSCISGVSIPALQAAGHDVVWVASHATACIDVLSRYVDELTQGAIITIEPGRVRIRSTQDE